MPITWRFGAKSNAFERLQHVVSGRNSNVIPDAEVPLAWDPVAPSILDMCRIRNHRKGDEWNVRIKWRLEGTDFLVRKIPAQLPNVHDIALNRFTADFVRTTPILS